MDYQLKIGGEAGFGIMQSGLIWAKTVARHGFNVFGYPEYPSLIHGGHNTFQLRWRTRSGVETRSQKRKVDVLVCLNEETWMLHQEELAANAVVIYDPVLFEPTSAVETPRRGVSTGRFLAVPFSEIVEEIQGPKVMINTVALGGAAAVSGLKIEILAAVIADIFAGKKESVIEQNKQAARAGYQAVVEQLGEKPAAPVQTDQQWLVMTGNEAAALGAIVAGCEFYCAYPMTPASSILHTLARLGPNFGMVVKQPEDEIAAINMSIGASFAGKRAMTATSGGGFSLMVEGLGLASMTEMPLVIIESQRPGPATGLPTWTGQGDLRFVMHAHQDEPPRIILAPGDAYETFTHVTAAFDLAEKYRLPVIVLIDKYLSESLMSVAKTAITEVFKPSAKSSPKLRAWRANSDEHNGDGFSDESIENRQGQMQRRMQKLRDVEADLPEPQLYGPSEADLDVIAWGSTKGPVLEALADDRIQTSGRPVNFLHLTRLFPFPTKVVTDYLNQAKETLVIEANFSGQLAGLIRQYTGHQVDEVYTKYDGRPFYPEEVCERIRSTKL